MAWWKWKSRKELQVDLDSALLCYKSANEDKGYLIKALWDLEKGRDKLKADNQALAEKLAAKCKEAQGYCREVEALSREVEAHLVAQEEGRKFVEDVERWRKAADERRAPCGYRFEPFPFLRRRGWISEL